MYLQLLKKQNLEVVRIVLTAFQVSKRCIITETNPVCTIRGCSIIVVSHGLPRNGHGAICDEFYGTEPLRGYGIGQDEDQGQLGAWYVMAALGIFDVQGHAAMNPTFQFGSPIFDKVTIQLDPKYYRGKELIIETKNNSKGNVYVQSISLNNQTIENCWIDRKKLTDGGTLLLEMGAEPNKTWGVKVPPPSMSDMQVKVNQ